MGVCASPAVRLVQSMLAMGYPQEYCGKALLKRVGYGSSTTKQEDEFFLGHGIVSFSGLKSVTATTDHSKNAGLLSPPTRYSEKSAQPLV